MTTLAMTLHVLKLFSNDMDSTHGMDGRTSVRDHLLPIKSTNAFKYSYELRKFGI